MNLLLLCCTLFSMAAASAQAPAPRDNGEIARLAQDPRAARGLDWLARNLNWVHVQHVLINQVPAPPFRETRRAAFLKKLLDGAGLKVRMDDLGNVIAERPGSNPRDAILIAAHLDTVFPPGTDVNVHQDGDRLIGPGISDNAVGLAALVAVARALHESKLRTRSTILLAANVGEEGEGNLRGMRKLVETYRSRLRGVIALDGPSTDHITSMALASRRFDVVITGPGGHSWADFGMPNPIHALSRGIARFIRVRVPEQPRTTFNVGQMEGGTSVNSIPFRASVKVDLRSESEPEIDRLEAALREAMLAGVDEEVAASRERVSASRGDGPNDVNLKASFRAIGARPGGEIAPDAPLLAAIRNVDRHLGIRSRLERSSTDANIPLSLGIPAIAIGAGGRGDASHSLREWYEPAGRELGLKRIFLTLLAAAGVEP